jgi:hypothetical protein
MLRCMRTTIRLDDALLAEAKATAARTGRTLTKVIEDALRESLSRGQTGDRPPEPADLPTFRGRGIQPGVDLDSAAALLDLMDDRAAG